MNRKPDWVAWLLQGLVGFVVGGFLGFAFVVKTASGRRGSFVADDQKSLFLLGLAVIGFGVASLLGDRLWLRDSYRHVTPDDPVHNPATKFASIAIGVVGAALVLCAIIRS
jgi:hypothetical protein